MADASHELRTPLATVRTNVDVLARADELAPDDRAMLIRETVARRSPKEQGPTSVGHQHASAGDNPGSAPGTAGDEHVVRRSSHGGKVEARIESAQVADIRRQDS